MTTLRLSLVRPTKTLPIVAASLVDPVEELLKEAIPKLSRVALTSAHRPIIIDFAIKQRLPTIFAIKGGVETGGLLSYAPSLSDRRAARYIDKVLKAPILAICPSNNLLALSSSSISRPPKRLG